MHIIEPTLKDKTGHRFSFVHDVLEANLDNQREFHIWLGRGAMPLFPEIGNVVEHPYFYRRIRQLQKIRLYKKLIREGEAFFISTATSLDFILISWLLSRASRQNLNINSIKFYMHWLYRSPKRFKRLCKVAQKYPQLSIACPTESVKVSLEEIGFRNVSLIPYPSTKVSTVETAVDTEKGFQRLLYAGAARSDKGFPVMVKIVAALKAEQSNIPVTLQCSTTHKGKHSSKIAMAIQQLGDIKYKYLSTETETLDDDEYRQLFANSIVVQPYDANLFADRVSGVLLDALKAGSPSVVPANTWMARMVENYRAGIVVEQTEDVGAWVSAIKEIIEHWPNYENQARCAAQAIHLQHSPSQLIDWLGS